MRNAYQTLAISRRTRLLTRTALSGALLAASAPAAAQAVPWIQQYYTSAGGTTPNGANAPTVSTTTPGITSITVNDRRTIIDTADVDGDGTSDFHPTDSNWFDVHFGTGSGAANRDWIAVFRSTGRIEIDGPLRAWLGDGTTTTGGNIWLLGQDGVFFTNNARVFTGGLLATTANFSNVTTFLNGTNSFAFNTLVNSGAKVEIASSAEIQGFGGTLAFVAPQVVSSGLIHNGAGEQGTDILFGAANKYTITFQADARSDFDLVSFEVDMSRNNGSGYVDYGYGHMVDVAGVVSTAGGNIYASAVNRASVTNAVINLGGTISATTATGGAGGNIVLSGGSGIYNRAPGMMNADETTGVARTSVNQVAINAGAVSAGGNLIVGSTGDLSGGAFGAGKDLIVRVGRTVAQSSTVCEPSCGGYGATVYNDSRSNARSAGIFLDSASAGDDLLLQAINGGSDFGMQIGSITLAGMSDAASDPVGGFEAAGDGVQMLLQTVRDGADYSGTIGRIAVGGVLDDGNGVILPPTGVLSGTGNLRIDSAGGAQVEVQGNIALTSVRARGGDSERNKIEVRTHSGSVSIGTATADNGNVLVDATGAATVGTATATIGTVSGETVESGVLSVHAQNGAATLTTGTAAGDVYVVADNGAATAGTITAGDDIFVQASNGAARLTAGIIDNSLAPGAADIDGGAELGYDGGPIIPGFDADDDGNGRTIQVKASGVGADAYLGLGTGGVGLTSADLSTSVNVYAGGNVFVAGGTQPGLAIYLSDVSAGGNASITGNSGTVHVGSLQAQGDASISALGGDLLVGYADASQDGGDQNRLTLSATGNVNASSLSAAGHVGIAADGNITVEDVSSYGTADIDAGGNANLTYLSTYGDLSVRAGSQITTGRDGGNGYGYVGSTDSYGAIDLRANSIVLNTATYADGAISLTAPGGMSAAQQVNAGGAMTISAGASTFYSVSAGGAINATFTGPASFNYVTTSSEGVGGAAFNALTTQAPATGYGIAIETTSGNLTINDIVESEESVALRSAGTLRIGQGLSAGGDVTLVGSTLDLPISIYPVEGALTINSTGSGFSWADALEATGNIDIRAAGGLTLTGGLTAGGNLTLAGTGAVQLGAFTAGNDVSITGGTLSLASLARTPGSLTLGINGDFSFASLIEAGTDVAVQATGNVTLGNVQAGDDIRVTGAALTLNNARTTNSNTNDANGANVTLIGTGAVQLASHNSAGDLSITGQTITLGGTIAPVPGSLLLRSTGGNFTYTGTLQAGIDLTVEASGNITLGSVRAGDDLTVFGQALSIASLQTLGGAVNDSDGADIVLTGSSISAGSVSAYDDVQATATGLLALGGTFSAGRDIRLVGGNLSLPATIAGARDLTISRTAGNFDAGSGYSAARDLTLTSNAELTVGAASAGRDLRLAGAKVTLASLMTTRDLSVSAGSGGVTASAAVNPGRDLNVTSAGDATFTTVNAGDDIRVTAGGKVTASSLTTGSGSDSEPDGRNIYVSGSSTAVGSSSAPGTVSITPAPAGTPTPPGTPTPTPVPAPWANASYGGVVNGNGAATSAASATMLDITLNSQRTLLDYGSTNGISDFRPSAVQGVTFHYGDRSWIAVVRSAGQIQVDGALRTVLGNSETVGGNLWLLSGAGVLFGANARVDVGGLLASTSGISNIADALDPAKSSFVFDTAGSSGVTIASGAQVRGQGGALVFVGPSVTSAAGSTVSGTGGTSVLYAATGPATVTFARKASGDLGFGSANGAFDTGAVNVAGTTNVDGSATLGGTSVGVGTLNAGGAVTMLASTGNVTVGTMTTTAGATFNAAGKVALGDVQAGNVRVVASDLDINTRLAATALQAESRGGDMALGGDGSAAGFALGNADFGRMTLAQGAAFYAGMLSTQTGQAVEGSKRAQATPARGNLVVGDLDFDPAKVPTLGLYADTGHTVSVVGTVKPTVTGGIIQVGDALAGAEWRPSAIAISGGFGSAIVYNEKCFDQVISLAELRLNAVGNVVFGDAAFQAAVANTAAASIDVARGTPSSGTGTDHIFAVTQKLTVGAGGKVVQQNTSKTMGAAIGILLANQDTGTDTVLSVSGGPTALDLFGSIIDQSGTLRSGINAAAAAELKVSGSVQANYRFNGCALASAAMCSKLDTSAVSNVKKSSGLKKEVEDADDRVGGN